MAGAAAAAKQVEAADFSPPEDGAIQPGLQPRSSTKVEAILTLTGTELGTAGYMSPEQLRGEKLDARTDIFSFGLVLYEMATGQRAFIGETAAIVRDAILNNPPAPVRELNSTIPAELAATIDKCLEKESERRYQSAAELRRALEDVKRGAENKVPRRVPVGWVAAVLVVVGLPSGFICARLLTPHAWAQAHLPCRCVP